MKNRLDYIPAIVMLLAALVSCIFTIIYRYEPLDGMLGILIAAIVFFIVGCIVKGILKKVLVVPEIEQEEEIASETSEEAGAAVENSKEEIND